MGALTWGRFEERCRESQGVVHECICFIRMRDLGHVNSAGGELAGAVSYPSRACLSTTPSPASGALPRPGAERLSREVDERGGAPGDWTVGQL